MSNALTPAQQRELWVNALTRIAGPVLESASKGRLQESMPFRGREPGMQAFTYLEALGRTLTGIAPWLENGTEEPLRNKMAEQARESLKHLTDPESNHWVSFTNEKGDQPLVDAAFLAHALLRAPVELWDKLDGEVKDNIIRCFTAVRSCKAHHCNWLLFAAMVETALYRFGGGYDRMRIDYALRMHEKWYKGDGAYGDGEAFHWDYYNSFVIQPMLTDILRFAGHLDKDWESLREPVFMRARRYARILEGLIAPDGTFPPLGRSIAYRFGAFHHLAHMAYRQDLPDEVTPAQVRCALTSVILRTMEAPDMFDDEGWLHIGLYGRQEGLGEPYISTGSLYLCSAVFLPLGLSPEASFWTGDSCDWSSRRIWSGADSKADHALKI